MDGNLLEIKDLEVQFPIKKAFFKEQLATFTQWIRYLSI